MDLSYTAEYERFREEVRAFLAKEWTFKGRDRKERAAAEAAFRPRAIAAGYLYRNIPVQYGGSGQPPDVLRGQIIREEFDRVGAPTEIADIGVQLVVPTLLENGADWQKEQFIPRTLSGEYRWAQGYSEPGSGSDLASLRTKAVLQGGQWVINGQKIWSTRAQRCQYMFALVRTEPDAPKHAGISYLLLDMRQPGVEVRPLKQMTGWSEFCEVFLTDAKTPANWIVGERGNGWNVSKTTLKHERSAIGGAERSAKTWYSLLDLARKVELNGKPAIKDPQVRQRLAMLAGSLAAQRYSSYRQVSMAARGEDAGLIQLLFKLYATNLGQDMAKVARDLIGDDLMLAPPSAEDWRKAGNEKWNNHYMGSIALSIAGGASNIQRNIIAERGLGLPRDKGEQRSPGGESAGPGKSK